MDRNRVFAAATVGVVIAAGAVLFVVGNMLASLFIYSTADYEVVARAVRERSRIYDFGLRANASAKLLWGRRAYPLYSNSMGFRDGVPRQVQLQPTAPRRRILLIGDSFTEGQGLPFEDTFAGQFGSVRPDLEVLNAASSGYSPSIYYRKIRSLIQSGFRFDELWVFIDLSDLQDEATAPFCDNPQDSAHLDCSDSSSADRPSVGYFDDLKSALSPLALKRHVLARRVEDGRTVDFFPLYKFLRFDRAAPEVPFDRLVRNLRGGWTVNQVDSEFQPLGIKAGLQKEWDQMERLHRLLAEAGIALNVAVYPWHTQMYFLREPQDEHVRLWNDFCRGRCARFVNLYEDFFRYRDTVAPKTWYQDLFIAGDDHFNAAGNRLIAKRLIEAYDKR